MRKGIGIAVGVCGFLLLLGAAGYSDTGTGAYILSRGVAGVILLAAGVAMAQRNGRKKKSH